MKIVNIIVILLSVCSNFCAWGQQKNVNQLSREEEKDGFQLLFDGQSLNNWINNAEEYFVEDGCIVKKSSGFGNLYSKEEFGNFNLRFEFQLTPGANNGLGLRHVVMPKDKGYLGMELQILDNEDSQYKDLKPYQYHGGLYNYVPAKRGYLKPVGEWNVQEVIADGAHIKIILNGFVILDTNLKKVTQGIPVEKIQPGLLRSKGHIAFLGHDSTVRFRAIRIKSIVE